MKGTVLSDNFQKLSNAQIEILKMFAKPMKKSDLSELKQTLGEFLSHKIDNEVDEIWKNRKLSQRDLDKIAFPKVRHITIQDFIKSI